VYKSIYLLIYFFVAAETVLRQDGVR